MSPRPGSSRWRTLQAAAHSPEAQEVIRQEISKGTIHVVPGPNGGTRIIPCGTDDGPQAVGVARAAGTRSWVTRGGNGDGRGQARRTRTVCVTHLTG